MGNDNQYFTSRDIFISDGVEEDEGMNKLEFAMEKMNAAKKRKEVNEKETDVEKESDDESEEYETDSEDDSDFSDDGGSIIFIPKEKRKPTEKIVLIKEEEEKSKKSSRQSSFGFSVDPKKKVVQTQELSVEDFEFLHLVGEGKFGKVFLSKKKSNSKYYAIKKMKKKYILKNSLLKQVKDERLMLAGLNHPFVVDLRYAFHSETSVYLVMQYLPGGELYFHMKKEKFFSEHRAKQYAAMIFLGIQYLHESGIIHRDLKPENILLDSEGYLVITDFGLSSIRKNRRQLNTTFVGTESFLSPEMISQTTKKFHNFNFYGSSIDYWALGIITFEMLFGMSPFKGRNFKQRIKNICVEELKFPSSPTISDEAKDFIKQLLSKNPRKRLGTKDSNEIKNHEWFKDIDFDELLSKKAKLDFVPNIESNAELKYVSKGIKKKKINHSHFKKKKKKLIEHQKDFEDFYLNKSLTQLETNKLIHKIKKF